MVGVNPSFCLSRSELKVLHIVPGTDDVANGMVVVAKLLAKEQGDAEVVDLKDSLRALRLCDSALKAPSEVWVHGMWLPKEWVACWRVIKSGRKLVRMTHGSLSPLYLKCQSPFKKWLVGPIERWCLRRCDRIVATCEAEKGWIQAYIGKRCPQIEVTDIKRFFKLVSGGVGELGVEELGRGGELSDCQIDGLSDCCSRAESVTDKSNTQTLKHSNNEPLHLLYLGRRHPLKGVEYLEADVRSLKFEAEGIPRKRSDLFLGKTNSACSTCSARLKIISSAFGDEKEKIWSWCDVLVLPTLSDNFGLVVAEALERGKRVITTDGAPAWGDGNDYGGRLIYLRGYRSGSNEERIGLLKNAIERFCE